MNKYDRTEKLSAVLPQCAYVMIAFIMRPFHVHAILMKTNMPPSVCIQDLHFHNYMLLCPCMCDSVTACLYVSVSTAAIIR